MNNRIKNNEHTINNLPSSIRDYFDDAIIDHEGNVFESLEAMVEYWGIPYGTFMDRIRIHKWPLEKALTQKKQKRECPAQDHLGNWYQSAHQMCSVWGISWSRYTKGIKNGTPLQEILECPSHKEHKGKKVVFENVEYRSTSALLQAFGVTRSAYEHRISAGWSMEKALKTPMKKVYVEDHFGNTYTSLDEMCKAYGIKSKQFSYRTKVLGLTVEQALTWTNQIIKSERKKIAA